MHAYCIKAIMGGRLISDRRGVSAIEFALLSPIFIGLLFGIMTFGVHLAAANSVAQLCGDVARATVAGIDEPERAAIAQSYLQRNIEKYIFLDTEHLSLSVADSQSDPQQFDVKIEYDASDLPAAVWSEMFNRPPPVIQSVATIRHGGF